jgi:hypothetical protein
MPRMVPARRILRRPTSFLLVALLAASAGCDSLFGLDDDQVDGTYYGFWTITEEGVPPVREDGSVYIDLRTSNGNLSGTAVLGAQRLSLDGQMSGGMDVELDLRAGAFGPRTILEGNVDCEQSEHFSICDMRVTGTNPATRTRFVFYGENPNRK